MASLFEITAEFRELYEIATGDDPAVLADTLEGMLPVLKEKAAGYVNVIQQLDMEAKKADELSKAFKAKAEARNNSIKAMKNALLQAMDAAQITEIVGGDFNIKIAKNGGVQPLTITGEVPENMTKVTIEPDNAKIRAFLKDNTCDWAHLEERGRHIVIK